MEDSEKEGILRKGMVDEAIVKGVDLFRGIGLNLAEIWYVCHVLSVSSAATMGLKSSDLVKQIAEKDAMAEVDAAMGENAVVKGES